MKHIILYLLSVLAILSCSDKNGYTIEGQYKAASDGTMLYLTAFDDILSVIDSAVVENGEFSFRGVCDTLSVCYLSSSKVVDGGFVVLEPGRISFEFGNRPISSGTQSNDAVTRFMGEKEKLFVLDGILSSAVAGKMNIEQTMADSLRVLSQMAKNVFGAYATKLIKDNADNPLGCFFFVQSAGVLSPRILNSVSELIPERYRGALYQKKIMQLELEDLVGSYERNVEAGAVATAVGKMYQNFELKDLDGRDFLMSDRIPSKNYTLLVFWAAWSDESVKDFGLLKEAYVKHKGQGLDIVAVSMDKSVEQCREAVGNYGLPWLQLCNPAGGSAELAAAYGVSSLPAYILINRNGTIILRTGSGIDLKTKFSEIF